MKRRILVVDDIAVFREPISFALQAEGYVVESAESGVEAIRIVERSTMPFDLMVVDYSMPEMNGLGFIARARGYAHMSKVATIMLTDIADKDIVVKARGLGVKDYVLKSSFSLSSFLKKVEEMIAAPNHTAGSPSDPKSTLESPRLSEAPKKSESANRPKVNNTDVLYRLKSFINKNPLPPSIQRVLSLTEADDVDGLELSRTISADSLLASRVLQMANSSVYLRQSKKISDIGDAIALLGFRVIRDIAATAYFCGADGKAATTVSWYGRQVSHAVCVAQLMDRLSFGTELRHAAQAIGLCHDLPEQILSRVFPAKYEEALLASRGAAKAFREQISVRLGVTYSQIVDTVISALQLPSQMTEPIMDFHGIRSRRLPLSERLSELLRLAHCFANALGYYSASDYSIDRSTTSQVEECLGTAGPFTEVSENLHQDISSRLHCLNVDFQVSIESLSRDVSVVLVSDGTGLQNDPLEEWFRLNSQVVNTFDVWDYSGQEKGDVLVFVSSSPVDSQEVENLASSAGLGLGKLIVLAPEVLTSDTAGNIQLLKVPFHAPELSALLLVVQMTAEIQA